MVRVQTLGGLPPDQSYWGLMQTLAWIMTGDAAFAGEQSNAQTDLRLELSANIGGRACSVEKAEEELRSALENKTLGALGLWNGAGRLEAIPPREWCHLTFYFDSIVRAATALRAPAWHNLTFERAAVQGVWPGNAPTPFSCGTVTPPSTQQLEAATPLLPKDELENFLRSLARDKGSPPAKRAAEKRARIAFPQYRVTRRLVEAAHFRIFGKLVPGKRT